MDSINTINTFLIIVLIILFLFLLYLIFNKPPMTYGMEDIPKTILQGGIKNG